MLTAPTAPVQFRLGTPPPGSLRRGCFINRQKAGDHMGADVKCEIRNLDDLLKKIKGNKKNAEKMMKRLTSDARKRVPGWVATEVTKVYGVKKGEITGKKLGTMTIRGNTFKALKFHYSGRLLTPTHFGMSPTAPKPGGGYTLKATFIKGQRTTMGKVKKLSQKQRKVLAKNFSRSGTQNSDHSPIMLMRANGGHYLPFQRVSARRNDIEAIKTISLPQMVSNEKTKEPIHTAINDGLQKRIDHYASMFNK